MKSKLDMAHEYMQNTLNLLRKHNVPYDLESLIEESFEYADAMYSKFESKKIRHALMCYKVMVTSI